MVMELRRAAFNASTGARFLTALSLCAGCSIPVPQDRLAPSSSPECPEESTASQSSPLALEDRHLVGKAADYSADRSLPRQEALLARSQRARRSAAWEIARRVLADVAPSADIAGGATLPAFQTWYGREELARIFRRAYAQLEPEARATRASLAPSLLDEAFTWNLDGVRDFPEWTEQRLDEYRRSVTDRERLSGLGGITRVSYSPSAARHLLRSYGKMLTCDAALGAAPVAEPESAPVEQGCATGPSPSRPSSTRTAAPCLLGGFPSDAVLVKADFRRAELGIRLPAYDTSADALARKLDRGALDWGSGDSFEDPGPDEIHTLTLPNGNRFRLAALHIMTKELEHWFWITLWWAPDPDSDFGADRPRDLGGPWQHYKMCAVTAFDEQDPEPSAGFAEEAPSLAAALAATHGGSKGSSWCSNPYLELGPGNAATNCIGCHQHAGTRVPVETILNDAAFPEHGRTELRRDFPTDYSYAPVAGDDLEAMFREAEQHFEAL
jgi:hypothetical protein